VTALLEVQNLSIWLRTKDGIRQAVDRVSFTIEAGEVLGMAGESGSGKTLTALSVLGLLPPGSRTAGQVLFDGRNLLTLRRKALRKVRGHQISLVSQDPMTSLHPMLRIEVQMTEHVRQHLGMSRRQARRRALDLLADVRIPDPEAALESHPGQFSGGMRQRLAIAMALACEPRLLLADEPTTALDVTVQAGILRLIDRLRSERGISVLLITHDLGVLSTISDRLCVLYGGAMVEYGPTGEVLDQPRHPYTHGLLQALPGALGAKGPLQPIGGVPPGLNDMPAGCRFHPRCRFAIDSCSRVQPPLRPISARRQLACDPDPLRDHDDAVPATEGAVPAAEGAVPAIEGGPGSGAEATAP
jgi:oligopeptide transport system ATP-binding protein